MMVARVILFLITSTMAKHHHSIDPNDNFFGNVYVTIHSLLDNLFESIGLGTNFTNASNTKLLLTKHYDLSNIADKTFETFAEIQKTIKNISNQSYFIYSLNEIEEDVTKLDTMVKDILNKKNFDVYRNIKGTQHKRRKHKTKVKDKSIEVNSNPAFDDSKEFTEFVVNFLAKVNNLTIQDFKKSSKHGRIAVPSKRNLKVWDTPSSLKYDLDSNYTRRIFRGSKTQVNSYPFIVSIHIMGEFSCSGCIISRDLVITAASCLRIAYKNDFFERNLKSIYVRLGSDHTTRGGETIPVQNLYFHPDYEPKHLLNNLALIKLEKRIRFSRQQKRIRRIIWDKTPRVLPNETTSIIILGWGATKKNKVIQKHPKLRVRMLDVYNTEDCMQKYTKDFITKENFCAAFNGTNGGACNGDVGGPAIVGAVLMGVVSFGAPECGAVGAPTVFTKLGYYVPWIESVMNAISETNQTNNDIINTRRKSKYQSKPVRNNKLHGRDEDYSEKVRALRDALLELVQSDQSVVDDVIYGDLYDEFSKYFKSKEQIESKVNLISTEHKREKHPATPRRVLEAKVELRPKPKDITSPHTPLFSTTVKILSLRKPPIDSEYETDNDVVQNDYTDNYEPSHEEERGLSIEIPTTKKSFEGKQDSSTSSESDSDKQSADDSSENSAKNIFFFAKNRQTTQKMDAYKMQTARSINFTSSRSYSDNVHAILRQGIRKNRQREVFMKHDQLSNHASSVLDEGRSLATKNFTINFYTRGIYINNDKRKHKNNRPDKAKNRNRSSKKSKDKSRSVELKAESFLVQF